ncbi:hypothetical protein BDF22DRAFT_654241 [Syncephalis plumigaleata]|nr:hypothetical protein BDF22DRAFT_654241 [Syncephalis plumigaleata]
MMKFLPFSFVGLGLAGLLATLVDTACSFAKVDGNIDIIPCDPSAQYPVVVHSVILDPNPPRFNSVLKVTVNADLHADVTTGAMAYAEGSVGLSIQQGSRRLCGSKEEANMECPILNGNNKQIVVAVPLPDFRIPVTADLKVNVVNGDTSSLFCFKTKVQIKP